MNLVAYIHSSKYNKTDLMRRNFRGSKAFFRCEQEGLSWHINYKNVQQCVISNQGGPFCITSPGKL